MKTRGNRSYLEKKEEDIAYCGLPNSRPNHPMNQIIQTDSQKSFEPLKELQDLSEIKPIVLVPSQVEPAAEVPHMTFFWRTMDSYQL